MSKKNRDVVPRLFATTSFVVAAMLSGTQKVFVALGFTNYIEARAILSGKILGGLGG